MSGTRETSVQSPTRLLLSGLAVLVIGMTLLVGVFYAAAQTSSELPKQRLAEAFADGTLTYDTYRQLEPVPGFLVAESDSNSSCIMYALALAEPKDLFGQGPWSDPYISSCEGLAVAVDGGKTLQFTWFRYWQGASAITRLALNAVSVYTWQLILTGCLIALVVLLIALLWLQARTFGVGAAIALLLMTDLLWQGFSAVHGVTASIGLAFVIASLVAFSRHWSTRWGIVALGGAAYAMTAQMLVPMAFAILTGIAAAAPLLRTDHSRRWQRWARAPIASAVWVGGYILGLVSRYVWAIILGPGLDELRGEVTGTSSNFITKSLIDPFYQVLGLLTKTWLDVGFMQVGLMAFFGVLGWSLARGGARGLITRSAMVALAPALLGVGWICLWAFHTNHTFVHVLLAMILLNVLFASEVGRRQVTT